MGTAASCVRWASTGPSHDYDNWKLCVDPMVVKEKYQRNGVLDSSCSISELELAALLDSPIAVRSMLKSSNFDQKNVLFSLWQACQDRVKRKGAGSASVLIILKQYVNVPFITIGEGDGANPYFIRSLYDELVIVQSPGENLVKRIFCRLQVECFNQIFKHVYTPFVDTHSYKSLCKLICDPNSWVTASSFTYGEVIARGSFGLVVECTKKSTGRTFAMKIQSKAVMMRHFIRDRSRVMTEMQALAECDHPYLTPLSYAFQTSRLGMLVMPILRCGDLSRALAESLTGAFSLERVVFYTAEIALALIYLHSYGLIYRDLKLANVLLNEDGNIMLADFGSVKDVTGILERKYSMNSSNNNCFDKDHSKFRRLEKSDVAPPVSVGALNTTDKPTSTFDPTTLGSNAVTGTYGGNADTHSWSSQGASAVRANSLVGTVEYMAPEIILKFDRRLRDSSYNTAVDWWSLGVMVYQMISGFLPFQRIATRRVDAMLGQCLAEATGTPEDNFYMIFGEPDYELSSFSGHSADFVRSLLTFDAHRRLCANPMVVSPLCPLRSHPFFADMDWAALLRLDVLPPVIPASLRSTKPGENTLAFGELADLLVRLNLEDWVDEYMDECYEPSINASGFASPRQAAQGAVQSGDQTGGGQARSVGEENSLSRPPTIKYKIDESDQGYFFGWNYVSPKLIERNTTTRGSYSSFMKSLVSVSNNSEGSYSSFVAASNHDEWSNH